MPDRNSSQNGYKVLTMCGTPNGTVCISCYDRARRITGRNRLRNLELQVILEKHGHSQTCKRMQAKLHGYGLW